MTTSEPPACNCPERHEVKANRDLIDLLRRDLDQCRAVLQGNGAPGVKGDAQAARERATLNRDAIKELYGRIEALERGLGMMNARLGAIVLGCTILGRLLAAYAPAIMEALR